MGRAFVMLDTETTGAGPNDRLCQIAFLVAQNGADLSLHQDLCKPPIPIATGAMAVHHITPEMVEEAPEYAACESAAVLETLNDGENILVIHNAPFDLGMLKREGVLWRGAVIDTLRCARHLIESESHALQFLRYHLGLYRQEPAIADQLGISIAAHDAAGDVVVLYLLMQHLLESVGKSAAGIEQLVTLSSQPVLIKRFRFGKYKGMAFEEIARSDPGYLDWLLKSEMQKSEPDEDLRHTLESHLKGRAG
jgi:DNA polymerase III epsilon subunit-like protein